MDRVKTIGFLLTLVGGALMTKLFTKIEKLRLIQIALFSDDKINVAQMFISFIDWIQKIVEKAENPVNH